MVLLVIIGIIKDFSEMPTINVHYFCKKHIYIYLKLKKSFWQQLEDCEQGKLDEK
jgi:hypothetical protein